MLLTGIFMIITHAASTSQETNFETRCLLLLFRGNLPLSYLIIFDLLANDHHVLKRRSVRFTQLQAQLLMTTLQCSSVSLVAVGYIIWTT